MNIFYFANKKFPNNAANSVQILKTCSEIKRAGGKLTLVGFKSKYFKSNLDIFYRYNIKKMNMTLLNDTNSYVLNEILFLKFLYLHSKKIDVIHTRSLIFAIFAKIFFRKKVVYEIHDFVKSKFYKSLFKFGVRKFNAIIVISNKLKSEISNLYGLSNVYNLPDGVSKEDFNISKSKSNLRKELNLDKNKFIITYVGSFKDFKGFFTLIESVKYIEKDDVLLLAIGGDKKVISNLNSQYSSYSNNFKLLSPLPHFIISSYLKASDVLIIPNSGKEHLSHNHKVAKYYTSPLKLFEYMCAKKPIIASDVPALREILNEECAYFIKPDSPKEIVKAMFKLKDNPDIIESLSENSFKEVEKYTWKKRGNSLFKIYKSIWVGK